MSENEQRPEPPIWRQIVGTVWRVEKESWRDAAGIGLVGGVIGAAGGFVVGWLLLVLLLQSASLFQ
jgi:hypothetical protein